MVFDVKLTGFSTNNRLDEFKSNVSLYWETVKEDVKSGAAEDRAIKAIKAEIGIIAGVTEIGAAIESRNFLIGFHGAGNYIGSIGDLANVIDGGDRNWNFAKKGYEKISTMSLGNKDFGSFAFYAIDVFISGYSLTKMAPTVTKAFTPSGIELTQYSYALDELRLPKLFIGADLATSLYITPNDAFTSYNVWSRGSKKKAKKASK